MSRWQRVVRVAGAVRSAVLDASGLGLLAVAAFTWSTCAGFVAAGVAVLAFNWRLEQGRG